MTRLPMSFAIICGPSARGHDGESERTSTRSFCHTPTQEKVVPRSLSRASQTEPVAERLRALTFRSPPYLFFRMLFRSRLGGERASRREQDERASDQSSLVTTATRGPSRSSRRWGGEADDLDSSWTRASTCFSLPCYLPWPTSSRDCFRSPLSLRVPQQRGERSKSVEPGPKPSDRAAPPESLRV